MSIFVTYFLKNFRNHKLRTYLILFSIALSSMMFYISWVTYGNMLNISLSQAMQACGSSDIVIKPEPKSSSGFFEIKDSIDTGFYKESIDSMTSAILTPALLKLKGNESQQLEIQGISFKDFCRVYKTSFASSQNFEPFIGKKIVLSKKTADKYKIKLNQDVYIDINGKTINFKVCSISNPTGYFLENGRACFAIVPKESLSTVFNEIPSMGNVAYVKIKDSSKIEQAISQLSVIYPGMTVKEPFTQEEANQETQAMSTAFLAITVVVFCMSVFIINSAFKVITLERLPIMGIFRSMGATKRLTTMVLSIESVIYGIIGGVIGSCLGVMGVDIIMYFTSPQWAKTLNILAYFSPVQFICALLIAVLLSLISSLIPISKASKMSLRNLVSGSSKTEEKDNFWVNGVGILLIIISTIIPFLIKTKIALYVDIVCLVFLIIGIIISIPIITNTFSRLLSKLYSFFLGHTGDLAISNIRKNKRAFNSISLITISISCLLMINVVSYSVISEIINAFVDRNYDIMIEDEYADKALENSLLKISGVSGAYGVYEDHLIEVMGKNHEIWGIQGVDKNKYLDYWQMDTSENIPNMLNQLESGRNIILTNMLKEKLSLQKGDTITLKMKEGPRNYKIVGFFDSFLFIGNYALISNDNLKADMGTKYFYRIYVKSSDSPKNISQAIKDKFRSDKMSVLIMKELKDDFVKTYDQLFLILKVFSIITLIIGVFGIINNLIISFMERSRTLALLRSIGLSTVQLVKMLFVESITIGIIASITGVISGLLLINNVQYLLIAIHQPVTIHYSKFYILIALPIGIIVMLLSSWFPIRRCSKQDIITSIKN